jgi:hypothetical protein
MENPKVITIVGRKWFDRVNGNTYHSVRAYVDGELSFEEPYTYGYGDQYRWTALAGLIENGHFADIERYNSGITESLSRYCDKHGIKLIDEVATVSRKKDL